MIGPVAKIDPADLPKRANIHWLGGKQYAELPSYLAGWDVALMPFALNDSTRFISPTKTPEYLAGGKPVVSTPITDVVRHYGELEGVRIAETPEEFVAAVEMALAKNRTQGEWLEPVDQLLAETSWDATWGQMAELIAKVGKPRSKPQAKRPLNGNRNGNGAYNGNSARNGNGTNGNGNGVHAQKPRVSVSTGCGVKRATASTI
jgi:UDP-galactopyranose mutase